MADLYINCPCCGRGMEGAQKCPHCNWSLQGANPRKALLAYSIFLLVTLVLGGAVYLYVRGFAAGVGDEPGKPATGYVWPARSGARTA